MAAGGHGYKCKAYGRFFSDPEIRKWDTKWKTIGGEKSLIELVAECPHCGETRGYKIPEDVTVDTPLTR